MSYEYPNSSSDSGLDSQYSEDSPALTSDASYMTRVVPVEETKGTFLDQFLCVLERVFRQGFHEKVALFLELFIPILFVIITVILWAVWDVESYEEVQFVNYSSQSLATDTKLYTRFVCYNSSGGNYIKSIGSCDWMDFLNLTCEGDESDLPVKGLCYVDAFGDYDPSIAWIASFSLGLWQVPELDDVIMYQWLAAKRRLGDELQISLLSAFVGGSRLSAIRSGGYLYFVGSGISGLIQFFRQNSELFDYVYGGLYATLDDAQSVMKSSKRNWAIIEVVSLSMDNFNVVIHLNRSSMPTLSAVQDPTYVGGYVTERSEIYAVSGFLTFQKLISEYYLQYVNMWGPKLPLPITNYFVPFGYRKFTTVPLLTTTYTLLPFMYVLSFLYPVSQLTKKIVLEKERRIRESMHIMGLGKAPMYISWYLVYATQYAVMCLIMVVLSCSTYLVRSDPYITFFFFYFYALCTISLSGLFATFFSKARLASLMTPLIYFVLAIPVFAITNGSGLLITIFSIFPPTAFAVITIALTQHEVRGGFKSQFNSQLDNPTVQTALLMLVADFFLCTILMLYFDAVFPKDWGTPKHPLFFIIDPIRWLVGKGKKHEECGPDGRAEDGVFEESDDEQENAVQLCGLRKEFKRGGKKFVAVDNLYWNIKTSEISVLLGHNGAGKSTTINMMTGMLQPDGGDCYVHGLSVRHQLSKVRQEIGFCPQHNILWPELTCREHLEFFGKIKGLKGARLEEAVQRMLHETDLYEKMNCRSSALSGGQKRKLSVGIAFVGESPLVFLDEPTAGMDVGARRHTWELLKRMSEFHTILLTTHYMDEADLLGHRIGIMNEGRLQCSGSSIFLKSRLGLGYSMAISVRPDADVEEIHAVFYNCINGVELLGYSGCELSYRLPQEEASNFPVLLDLIEESYRVGVLGYSLSATTLEEVFLRVSRHMTEVPFSNNDFAFLWNCRRCSSIFSSQFVVLIKKRWCNALRDRRMQCFQLVCPIVCVLVAMLLGLVKTNDVDLLELSFGMYPGQTLMDTAQCNEFWGDGPSLPHVVINETHLMNAKYLGDYGADTWFEHSLPRYASISCIDRDLYQRGGGRNPVIMLYNTSVNHQVGISMAAFYQLLLGNIARGSANVSWYVGTMPSSVDTSAALELILMGAIIMIPFTFLPSNPVAWVVKERECGALHLQKVAGLRFYTYWLTNFLFDLLAYIVSVTCIVLLFVIFQRWEYIGGDTVGPLLTLLLMYGLTSTVAGYAISFLFGEHSTAQTVVMAVGFVTGFLLVMVVYVLSLLEKTATTSDKLRWPFRLVPTYCIGEGIINLGTFGSKKASGVVDSAFDPTVTGYPILFLGIEFPVFVLLVLFIDHPSRRIWWDRLSYRRQAELHEEDFLQGDSDVEDERNAVYDAAEHGIDDGVVTVLNLQKSYGSSKLAVRNITFSIMPGEVFAFLGTNGAGKTTTISMLCQQFVIESLLLLCDIARYRRTLAHELSGGNRRKLSVAISLVGGPRVVFLDEPSAGMDPVARRGLWTTIQKASMYCSVVLTTHHLEEVEALADVVVIMVDGTLRCIGDKVHLKNKYGSGYEMHLRVNDAVAPNHVESFVSQMFPGATLNEYKGQRFVYALARDTSLANAFRILQQYKDTLGITDYSVSQTSIEQVFLRISGEM
ncbi:ABC transporter-like [Trypanosoma melophagium]|uniref:ABC transporter-like n=1 Tax=Trypanosoma melophagium TaxID=715481 RepID=UPI00351A8891|nr:ABC transporter-like [Trypanosoma melophagium]